MYNAEKCDSKIHVKSQCKMLCTMHDKYIIEELMELYIYRTIYQCSAVQYTVFCTLLRQRKQSTVTCQKGRFPKRPQKRPRNKKTFNPTKFYDWSIHDRFGNSRFGNGLSGMILQSTHYIYHTAIVDYSSYSSYNNDIHKFNNQNVCTKTINNQRLRVSHGSPIHDDQEY